MPSRRRADICTSDRRLANCSIKALRIEDSEIYFNDLSEKAAPIRVHHLDFDVTDFDAASAFDVETKFAFPGDEQNIDASGKLGPLLYQGVLDASGIPVDLNLKLDSIVLDRLRPLADVGSKLPPELSIRDAASVSGTTRGSFGKLAIALNTDLTANRVAYAAIFNKPAATPMTVNANGPRIARAISVVLVRTLRSPTVGIGTELLARREKVEVTRHGSPRPRSPVPMGRAHRHYPRAVCALPRRMPQT
jgi:hypothetical protein